jgi:hypothetical protein
VEILKNLNSLLDASTEFAENLGENGTVADVCVANGRAAASRIGATTVDRRCSSGAGAVHGRQN